MNEPTIICPNCKAEIKLTEQHEDKKIQEYQERHRFWADKRISQLSFQNNIYLTISLAAIGYLWSERRNIYTDLIIDTQMEIDWKIVMFFLCIITLAYSTFAGLFLSVSRLYDLRLVSNILLTRKRAKKEKVKIADNNTSHNGVCKSIHSLWKVFRKYDEEYEISYEDVKGEQKRLQEKFTEARQRSRDIGNSSWILMKNQTVSLLISFIVFMILLIIQ